MATQQNRMVEQHIREHQARLKHMDEMLERADNKLPVVEPPTEVLSELKELHQARDLLAQHLEQLHAVEIESEAEKKIEQMGPMLMWELVAGKLEKLVQRLEH